MAKMQDDWKAAKKAFETLTGKHKPAKSFLIFFHKSTNIEKYLKECDTQAEAKTVDVAKLKKAMADLKGASDVYLKELKAEKADENGGNKDVVTVVTKGISSLRQSLKKYEAHYETVLKTAEVTQGNANPKQKMIDGMLIPYESNVKAALANAKAVAARLNAVSQKLAAKGVKLADAIAYYNKVIGAEEAARKLTTALGAYGNIKSMGGDVSQLTDPQPHLDALKDYSNRQTLGKDTTEKVLTDMIEKFEKAVKAVKV